MKDHPCNTCRFDTRVKPAQSTTEERRRRCLSCDSITFRSWEKRKDHSYYGMIREKRQKARITLRALSWITGKKIGYLSDLEHGRIEINDLELITLIDKVLGFRGDLINHFRKGNE